MGIFRKQTARAPWTTVLLVLLLALSIAASSIGFTAWVGARKQFEEIDDQYTTIGIHAGLNYDERWAGGYGFWKPQGLDSYIFYTEDAPEGLSYTGPRDAAKMAAQSPYFVSSSSGQILSAHVAGSTGLTSGTKDILDYIMTHDSYCYNLSVFAVKCVGIEELSLSHWNTYTVTTEIIDPICRMEAYDLPTDNNFLNITTSLYNADGTIPFEIGKTYLVRGRYWDHIVTDLGYQPVIDEDGNEVMEMVRGRYTYDNRNLFLEGNGDLLESYGEPGLAKGVENFNFQVHREEETGMLYFSQTEDCWPYFAEYEGDWRDYLASEAGTVWREEIIPTFEINHASAPVILTDNVNSLYLFNTGDASILEGRSIEKEEYESGSDVCLVSASYAKLNGLSVGDTISLDYYNSGYDQTHCVVSSIRSFASLTQIRKPMMPSTRMDITKDYTIVGIYTSPEWTPGIQNFHADTIFVPKASVPGADQIVPFMYDYMSAKSMSRLNTISIQNGSIEEFEAHMEENGMAGVYLYFDQGYSEAAASVQTMIDNAMRLMLVGVAMFVLASMIFLLLFSRRTSSVMRSMRLLGVPKKQTWLECLGTLFTQEVIAVLLGNALAVILYERITAQLLSSTPTLSMESVLLCGGVQLGALLLVGGVWMNGNAGRNLMQKHEGGFLWKRNKAASCGA